MHDFDVEAAADDQPGDQRVRVPHLARSKLVASPHRRRYFGHELEDPPGESRIVRQSPRTPHRLVDVRDHAVTPAPDLVPEDA